MIDIYKAIEIAMSEHKKEFGPDARFEEGEAFVTVFKNAAIVIGLEDRELSVKVIGGLPYISDEELDIVS